MRALPNSERSHILLHSPCEKGFVSHSPMKNTYSVKEELRRREFRIPKRKRPSAHVDESYSDVLNENGNAIFLSLHNIPRRSAYRYWICAHSPNNRGPPHLSNCGLPHR